MADDELLKMLGLDKPPAEEEIEEILDWNASGAGINEEEHRNEIGPTVFKVNDWDLEQGERLADADAYERRVTHSNEEHSEHAEMFADFFTAAFQQSPEVGKCIDQLRQRFVQTLLETPDYKVLHESTMWDVFKSDSAAKKFAEQFDEVKKKCEGGKCSPTEEQMACIDAAGAAVQEAQEECDEYDSVARGLGQGCGPSEINPAALAKTFERVKKSKLLKRICELAGRYRLMAQAKQRQKVSHGQDEMVGIEMSGDLKRLLPSEMALLDDEDLELDTLRRLIEGQCLSWQYRGSEKVGKGPIIVCVDESGSMSGEPVCNAKAFALAMAWIARHQGRPCILLAHTGHDRGRHVEILPGKWKGDELTNWLEFFFGGGSHMDVPFDLVPHVTKDKPYKKKIDVITITDAISTVPSWMADTFNNWKKENNARCIGIVIGYSCEGDLQKCCDETFAVREISVEVDAIHRCLSI